MTFCKEIDKTSFPF